MKVLYKIYRVIEIIMGIIIFLFSIVFLFALKFELSTLLLSLNFLAFSVYLIFFSPKVFSMFSKAEKKRKELLKELNKPMVEPPKETYYYAPIIRDQTYMYYIDYLFSAKKYYADTKEEIDIDDYNEDDIIDKYSFESYPCKLIPNGDLYDVEVSTPICTETIGQVEKRFIPANMTKVLVGTSGGVGWKVYCSKDDRLRLSSETFFPYEVRLVVYFVGDFQAV